MDDRARIERVVRMYNTNQDAARALSMAPNSLIRRCRRYGLPTPSEAHRRRMERGVSV